MKRDSNVSDLLQRHGITNRTRDFLLAEKRHYINGEFVAPADNMMPVLEPCTSGRLTLPLTPHLQ